MPILSPNPSTIAPTARRLNLRLFGSLVGIAAVLALGLHLLHRWQVDQNAEGLLKKAEAAQEAGEPAQAIRFYSQYLKYRPHNIEAQASLGMLLDEPAASSRNLLNAFMLYESVLREDPSRQTIRRRLVDVLLRLGRFSDALGHLNVLLSAQPHEPDLLFQKGRCEEGNRQFSQAAGTYLLAVHHDRQEIDHHAALIELVLDHYEVLQLSEIDPHHREDVSKEQVVEALSNRMVDQGIPRARALLVRSRQRLRAGELPLAVADIREALQLAGNDPEILFAAAEMELAQAEAAALEGRPQQRQEHTAAAEKIAKRGLEKKPPVLKLAFITARIARERGDVPGSAKALSDGLSHFPDILHDASPERTKELVQVERMLLFYLADLKICFPDKVQDSRTVGSFLDRMRQLVMPRAYLDFLLVQQAIVENRWASAISKLELLKTDLRSDRELSRRIGVLLGRCYQAVGNPQARLAVLNRTIEENPLWTAGRLEYARALADAKRIEEAAAEYALLIGVDGVVGELFRMRMLQELALPEARRDWTRVEEALDLAAGRIDPAQLTTLRVEVRVQQKKYNEAADLLNSALEDGPAQASTHAARALLALRRDDWQTAQRMAACRAALDKAEAELGPRAEWEMIRAEMALLEPDAKALKTLQTLTQRTRDFPPDAARRLLERIAQSYREKGASKQSERIWRELADRYPHELNYWAALAQPLSDAGELEKLQPILKQIRRIEGGNGGTSQFLLAAAMLVRVDGGRSRSGELEQATQILSDTARKYPHWAAVVRAQGHAAELGGDPDQALRYFREALRLGDSSPEVVLRILQSLARRGQQEEAMQLTSRLADQGSSIFAGDAGRFARALAVQQQDLEGAVDFAYQVWQDSESFWDLLWLAEVRFQAGERGPEVDDLFRQAVQQAPDESATWLSLIGHLQRTGQFAQAQGMIAEAKNTLPPALVPSTLARCYEILGNVNEAALWHHQAVQSSPGNVRRLKEAALFHDRIGNHEQAQKYLSQITAQSTDAEPSDIAWTRRNQALLLAAEGGYDHSIEAVKLLEQNDRGPLSEALANLRAKAIILSQRPVRKDRLEAIGAFLEIRKKQGYLTPEDQLKLARLYDQTGQWPKASEAFQQIVTSNLAQPEHVAEFAVALIRHDEAAQAALWVRTLQQTAPDAFVTATTQTWFNQSMGKSDLALATIKNWLKSHRPAKLEPRLRQLPEETRFEQKLADLQASAKFNQQTAQLLNQAKELVEQDRSADARSLVHQFVIHQDLTLQRYAEQLGSSAALLEELRLLAGAEELYRDHADFTGQPQSTFVLAKFLSRQGRIGEALDLCAEIRNRADPEMLAAASVSVLGRSGIIGSREISPEQFRLVESWVKTSLAATGQSPVCLVALADLRLLEQRLDEAERLYLQVLPSNDRHVVALNNVAWLKAFLHDKPPESIHWINRAIEVAGPRADLLDTRAVIHILARRADSAVRDLENALNEGAYAIGYLHLAEAKALKGEFPAARAYLDKAHEMHLSQDRLHPLEKQLYDRLMDQLPSEPKDPNRNQTRVTLTP